MKATIRQALSGCMEMMTGKGLVFAVSAVLGFALSAGAAGPDGVSRRKFVMFGWEFGNATPSNILEVVDSLDGTPVDGIGLYPRIVDRNGRRLRSKMMDQPALEWADLEPWVPVLRELSSHRSMRESMMKTICAPTNRIDWTDDAAWRRISETMRQLTRFSREGGLKGVWVDDEDYHKQRQYYWRPGDPAYGRLCEIVRQRGREVFSAMFSEYPDMTVLFFRLFTRNHRYRSCSDMASAQRSGGDLWPSFLNGMLDVLPPAVKIVDGYEYGYRFAKNEGYFEGCAYQKTRFVDLVDPVNRAKYFMQVSSAAAMYMDMYTNKDATRRWYAPPLNGSRAERLVANVALASQAVDEYIWFWGERNCWAKWKNGVPRRKNVSTETWEEKLPGISEQLKLIKCPEDFAKERLALLKRTGKYRQLNPNMECRKPGKVGDNGLAVPYSGWIDPKGGVRGHFGFDTAFGEDDSSSVFAEGVPRGCITVNSRPLKPGRIYIVGFSAKGDIVGGTVYWQRDTGWDFSIPGRSVSLSAPDEKGWRHGLTAVRVPDGAEMFGLQLSVGLAPGERCWYDNVFYCEAE